MATMCRLPDSGREFVGMAEAGNSISLMGSSLKRYAARVVLSSSPGPPIRTPQVGRSRAPSSSATGCPLETHLLSPPVGTVLKKAGVDSLSARFERGQCAA